MLVSNQTVETTWVSSNKQHYIDKGYIFTRMREKFLVKVEDLPSGSHLQVKVVCDYCGDTFYKHYANYLKEHTNGKDCCKNCWRLKAQETCKEKYGAENPFASDKIKEKIKSVFQEKYGVDNPSQAQEVKDKIVQTNLAKYGVTCAAQNEEIKQKIQKTCVERYGVKNVFELKEVQEKIRETNRERYGEGNIAHTPEISEKIKQTNLKRYGVEYSCQAPEVIAKIRQSLYRNGNVPSSGMERELCNLLHEMFGEENCQDNFAVSRVNLDCLVNLEGNLLDFEYDGYYWHKDREEHDRKRDYFLRNRGYKVIRIKGNKRDNKMPTKEQIQEAVDYLVKGNHSLFIIDLMNI